MDKVRGVKIKLKNLAIYQQDTIRSLGNDRHALEKRLSSVKRKFKKTEKELASKDQEIAALKLEVGSKDERIHNLKFELERVKIELERKHWENERYRKKNAQSGSCLNILDDEVEKWYPDNLWESSRDMPRRQHEKGIDFDRKHSHENNRRKLDLSAYDPTMWDSYAKAIENIENPSLQKAMYKLLETGIPQNQHDFVDAIEKILDEKLPYVKIVDAWYTVLKEIEKDRTIDDNGNSSDKHARYKKVKKSKEMRKAEHKSEDSPDCLISKNVDKYSEIKKRLYDEMISEIKPKLQEMYASMKEKMRREIMLELRQNNEYDDSWKSNSQPSRESSISDVHHTELFNIPAPPTPPYKKKKLSDRVMVKSEYGD